MSKKQKPRKDIYSIPSLLIHGHTRDKHWDYSHHVVPPLSSSTAYRLSSAARGARGFAEYGAGTTAGDRRGQAPIYIYDRLAEPTRDMLEEALATAERGEIAVTFASGMAAVSAALSICAVTGEHIIAHNVIYGSTYSLLTHWMPKYKIGVTLTNLRDPVALRRAIRGNTRVIYFESPANPNLELIDIAAVRQIIAEDNARRPEQDRIHILVDNTFASPFCQRPIEHGADLVVHSATKYIGGHGDVTGGTVAAADEATGKKVRYQAKLLGAVLGPNEAWLAHRGLKTLSLRIGNS